MAGMNPQALTCRHGHYRWADWRIKVVVIRDEASGAERVIGAQVLTPCDHGTHYLTPTADGAIIVRDVPHAFASEGEALRALYRYDEERKHSQINGH